MKKIRQAHICWICFLLFLFLNACTISPIYEEAGQQKNLLRASNVNVQLGMDYLKKNNVTIAKQRFFMALNQAPKNPYVQDALAYFFEVTGDDANAEYYYKRAIKFSSDSGAFYNNYGTYLCRKGRYNAAIKQFQRAVNDTAYLHTSAAYENAGICSLNKKNLVDAKQYFSKALEYSPNSVLSLAGMADLFYLNNDLSQAKIYLSRLSQVAPNDPLVQQLSQKIKKKASMLYAVKRAKIKRAQKRAVRQAALARKAAQKQKIASKTIVVNPRLNKKITSQTKISQSIVVNPIPSKKIARQTIAMKKKPSKKIADDQTITRFIVTKGLVNSQPNNQA